MRKESTTKITVEAAADIAVCLYLHTIKAVPECRGEIRSFAEAIESINEVSDDNASSKVVYRVDEFHLHYFKFFLYEGFFEKNSKWNNFLSFVDKIEDEELKTECSALAHKSVIDAMRAQAAFSLDRFFKSANEMTWDEMDEICMKRSGLLAGEDGAIEIWAGQEILADFRVFDSREEKLDKIIEAIKMKGKSGVFTVYHFDTRVTLCVFTEPIPKDLECIRIRAKNPTRILAAIDQLLSEIVENNDPGSYRSTAIVENSENHT